MQSQNQAAASTEAHTDTHGLNPNGLTDDALSAAGLVKVSAFIRNEMSTNAKRVKRAREKSAMTGIRQLNIAVPTAAHDAIKSIASQLQAGCDPRVALERALYDEVKKSNSNAVIRVTSALELETERGAINRLAGLRGWRRLVAWLLRIL